MFSCEICEIFNNTFFAIEHLQVAAFETNATDTFRGIIKLKFINYKLNVMKYNMSQVRAT